MKVPQNIITTGKYTIGKEFIDKNTHKPYQGYYYELNNKYFIGKEFNNNAPEIIKLSSDNVNKLLLNDKIKTYGSLSKIKLSSTKIKSQPEGGSYTIQHSKGENEESIFFYCKKYNEAAIKKIDEETYNLLQKDNLFATTFVGTYNNVIQNINDAEKQIPGVKDWITSDARGLDQSL